MTRLWLLIRFRFLNLNGPIQLGGVSTVNLPYPKLTVTDFTGCIRNFITNDKYYDLKNPSNRNGSKEGCPIVEQNCVGHQCHAHAKCVPSWTGYSCSCPFGSFGPMCGQRMFYLLLFLLMLSLLASLPPSSLVVCRTGTLLVLKEYIINQVFAKLYHQDSLFLN